jgi:phospholipid/cholesterol/gamma-HCH transport system substrate-binding protein
MEREAHYTAVGAFVILVTVMAGLFVYWYSEGRDRHNYVQYEIYFPGSVTGLSEGGSVRYLGVEVGKVRRIQLDSRSASRVQVITEIDQSAPISDKTTAELSLLGITGLLYIDLRQNLDGREVFAAVPSEQYPVINTARSNFDSFLASLPEITTSAAELLQRAQQIFSPENSAALADMVKSLHAASAGLPDTMKRVDTLVVSLTQTSAEVQRFANQLNESVPYLGPKVWEMVDRLNKTADHLQGMTANLDQLLTQNGPAISGFMQDGLPELQRTLGEARVAVEQFQELSRTLNEDPSRLIYQPQQRGFEVAR